MKISGIVFFFIAVFTASKNLNIDNSTQALSLRDSTVLRIQSGEPEDAVRAYCLISSSGDSVGVRRLISELPDAYLFKILTDKNEAEHANEKDRSIDVENRPEALTLEEKAQRLRKSLGGLVFRTLIDNYPADIRDLHLEVVEITEVTVVGNSSRVLATLRSKKDERLEIKWGFLLTKELESWKIFKISESAFVEDFPVAKTSELSDGSQLVPQAMPVNKNLSPNSKVRPLSQRVGEITKDKKKPNR